MFLLNRKRKVIISQQFNNPKLNAKIKLSNQTEPAQVQKWTHPVMKLSEGDNSMKIHKQTFYSES